MRPDHRLMPGEHLRITVDSYKTDERHHEIADRVMRELHYNPRVVCELRISEARIQVDVTCVAGGERRIQTHYYDTKGKP